MSDVIVAWEFEQICSIFWVLEKSKMHVHIPALLLLYSNLYYGPPDFLNALF